MPSTRPSRCVSVRVSSPSGCVGHGVVCLCTCELQPTPAYHMSHFFLQLVVRRHLSMWGPLGLIGISCAVVVKKGKKKKKQRAKKGSFLEAVLRHIKRSLGLCEGGLLAAEEAKNQRRKKKF